MKALTNLGHPFADQKSILSKTSRSKKPVQRASRATSHISNAFMGSQGNGKRSSGESSQPLIAADGSLAKPTRLSIVVTDAVRRWYLETEREAERGDVKAQALLGQMLTEGYGCEADPVKGREWIQKARQRGYRMDGVYCKI